MKKKKGTFARLGINDCLITTDLRVNFQLYHILLFNLLYFPLLIILRITDKKYFQLEQTHLFHGFSRLKILQITFTNTEQRQSTRRWNTSKSIFVNRVNIWSHKPQIDELTGSQYMKTNQHSAYLCGS